MNTSKGNNNVENIQEIFDKENKLILELLFENRHLFQTDELDGEVTPLLQHRWQVMSRKLQLYGCNHTWIELRNKFKYWVKNGIIKLGIIDKICTKEENNKDDSDGSDSPDCSDLIPSFSNPDFQNLPYTSTPKSAPKHTTNFVCNVTISPMANVDQRSRLIFDRKEEGKYSDKIVQTTTTLLEEKKIEPSVFYIDPNTCELKPVEKEEEVLALETLTENINQESKRRKLEMTVFEKNILEQQKKLFQLKMEQREKEHKMKMKLLEHQLKSGMETHQLELEIAQLKRQILAKKVDTDDLALT